MNWILVALLAGVVLLAGVEAAQIADLKTGVTGAAVSTGDGQIDTTGWTADEIMNYEMHGVIPARASGGSTAKPASTMVGGC